ncbi:MAG: biotin/lipoyl-binding protein [Anaerolineae bacterium]
MTKYTVDVHGDVFDIEVGRGGWAWVNQEPYEVDFRHLGGNGEYSLLMSNRSYEIHVADRDNGHRWVTVGGRRYRTRLQLGRSACRNGPEDAPDGGLRPQEGPTSRVEIRAPLPGLLVELHVREGEHIEEQQVVAVLESMKMNLELRAPGAGVVRDVCAAPGRQVAQDDMLVVVGPSEALHGRASR